MTFDHNSLKEWFLTHKRDLPWRENPSPYAVWVSEMMLQQTQVNVVIPYFMRWMQRFPSIQELARAELDEVIKIWEGLGYYSRARYLHQGAKQIVDQFNGKFPKTDEELSQIKGLGPYTKGAIQSFAFHKNVSAVDGNVIRVLSRYYCIEDDVSKPQTVSSIRELATSILPKQESWIFNEALIELGALVCTRTPNCKQCPLKKSCLGYAKGKENALPHKTKKIQITQLYRAVAIIKWKNYCLLQRGVKGKLMSDLHEFPYFDVSENGICDSEFESEIRNKFGCKVTVDAKLNDISQSFTRYRVKLWPVQFICTEKRKPTIEEPFKWVHENELNNLAFSSGHKRIKMNLNQQL